MSTSIHGSEPRGRRRFRFATRLVVVAMITAITVSQAGSSSARAADEGILAGTVTGPAGESLADVEVDVFKRDGEGGWEDWGTAWTDEDGYWSRWLPAGEYRLGYSVTENDRWATEYLDDEALFEDAESVVLEGGGRRRGLDAELAVDLTRVLLGGTLTGPDGEPLGDQLITVYGSDGAVGWEPVEWAWTDQDGVWSRFLPPGEYRIGFGANEWATEYFDDQAHLEDAESIVLGEGESRTDLDAELAVNPTRVTLGGTVTGSEGGPIWDANVIIYKSDGNGDWRDEWETWTDEDGAWSVTIPAGEYRVGYSTIGDRWVPEFFDDELLLEDAESIVLGEGESRTDLDAELAVDLTRVTLGGAVTGPEGDPLSDVAVVIYKSDGNNGWRDAGEVGVDEDGVWSVTMPAGEYRVGYSTGGGDEWAAEYFDDVASVEDAESITLQEGESRTDLDAELAVDLTWATLGGLVTGPEGDPLSDISVDIYGRDGESGWRLAGVTDTGQDGLWSLRMRLGEYRVAYVDYTGKWITEYFDDQALLEDAASILLAGGESRTDLDAELAAEAVPGTLSGVLTGPDGEPLDSVGITVYEPDGAGGWALVPHAPSTDEDGHWETAPLPAGDYRVGFSVEERDEWSAEFYDDEALLTDAETITLERGESRTDLDARLAAEEPDVPAIVSAAKPVITGVAKAGVPLSVSSGSWTVDGAAAAGLAFKYEWRAGGTAVGTNLPTYTPGPTEVGKTIMVTVTATKSGHTSGTATSDPTAQVVAATPSVNPSPQPSQACVAAHGAVTSATGVLEQAHNQLVKAKKRLKKLKRGGVAAPKVKKAKAKAKVRKAKQAVGAASASVVTATGQVVASC